MHSKNDNGKTLPSKLMGMYAKAKRFPTSSLLNTYSAAPDITHTNSLPKKIINQSLSVENFKKKHKSLVSIINYIDIMPIDNNSSSKHQMKSIISIYLPLDRDPE